MHDGCTGSSGDGLQMLQKIRMMGFNTRPLPAAISFDCKDCGEEITMTTLEFKCPHCEEIYAVTPCSANNPDRIASAGKHV